MVHLALKPQRPAHRARLVGGIGGFDLFCIQVDDDASPYAALGSALERPVRAGEEDQVFHPNRKEKSGQDVFLTKSNAPASPISHSAVAWSNLVRSVHRVANLISQAEQRRISRIQIGHSFLQLNENPVQGQAEHDRVAHDWIPLDDGDDRRDIRLVSIRQNDLLIRGLAMF